MRATYTAIKNFDCSNDDSLGYIKNHKDQTNGKDTYSLFFRKDGRALRILHINVWRKTYEKDNFKHGKNCRADNGSFTYFCRLFKR